MLAKRVDEVPREGNWIYEPKWDGFRVLVFRDGDEVLIQSRDQKSLNRYFPEMIDPLRKQLPSKCVLDGELVIAHDGRLDFDALQLRIHPAASRVKLLAAQTPASCVFFDLLCKGDRDLRNQTFRKRRSELELLLAIRQAPDPHHARNRRPQDCTRLVPPLRRRRTRWCSRETDRHSLSARQTRNAEDKARARLRLRRRRLSLVQAVSRKRSRLVIARPLRRRKGSATRRSLRKLLCRNPSRAPQLPCSLSKRRSAQSPLEKLGQQRRGQTPQKNTACPAARADGVKARIFPGSRFVPELVVEVAYEHMQSGRFRHMAHFRRWRTDRKPSSCTFAQLEVVPPEELKAIFAEGR